MIIHSMVIHNNFLKENYMVIHNMVNRNTTIIHNMVIHNIMIIHNSKIRAKRRTHIGVDNSVKQCMTSVKLR